MSLSDARCYWPNGKEVLETNYQPCEPGEDDPDHAACCDLRNSVCTREGYCIGNANYVYRGACTDDKWRSSSCPQSCATGDIRADGFMNILDCGDGAEYAVDQQQWCCSEGRDKNCCDSSFNVAIGAPYFPTESASTGSASETATSSVAPESTVPSIPPVSQSPDASQPDNASLSQGDKIGVGVGVGVGGLAVILIAMMAYFMFLERKRRIATEKKFEATMNRSFEGTKPLLGQSSGQAHTTAHEKPHEKPHEAPQTALYEVQGD